MAVTEEERAAGRAATARARAVLKPGDRIGYTVCCDMRRTATFVGWDGEWITSKMLDNIHALHIVKVNGVPTSFRNPEENQV